MLSRIYLTFIIFAFTYPTLAGVLKTQKEILDQALESTLLITTLHGKKFVSRGAGTIISSDGHFVTNYHVLKPFLTVKKIKLSLKLSTKDGDCFDSIKLLECQGDKKADICLLKIEGKKFKHFFRQATIYPKKGHNANMIGHCKKEFFSSSLTLESECFKYDKFFEGKNTKQVKNLGVSVCATNIDHCPGDSGGPVFNDVNGNLIGMITEETTEYENTSTDVKGKVLKSWKTMIAYDELFSFYKKYKYNKPTLLGDVRSCGNETMFPESEEQKLEWLKQFTK